LRLARVLLPDDSNFSLVVVVLPALLTTNTPVATLRVVANGSTLLIFDAGNVVIHVLLTLVIRALEIVRSIKIF
jgi:hypothetical protein